MSTSLELTLEAGERALLIEPEDATRRSVQLMLQGWLFSVRSFSTAGRAFADSYAQDAHVLLVALRVPEGEGFAVFRALRRRGWQGRGILLADARTAALTSEARRIGFTAVLDKPVSRLELFAALSR